MTVRQPPSVGSMFAGIGGFDIGFEREGFRLAWCIEKDPAAQKVLARRFPSATIYGDITKVDASTLERVDVVCGGFPCQDVSVAGKRAGLAGARTGLFYDAVRIIRQLQPSLLILENVLGLLSSNSGRDFAAVLREVGEGWGCKEVAWRVLDSQYFGVAQRRKRVFVVASAAIGHAEKILALNESVRGDPPTRRKAGQDASASAEGCPASGSKFYGTPCWYDGGSLASCMTSSSHRQSMPDKGNFSADLTPTRLASNNTEDSLIAFYSNGGSQGESHKKDISPPLKVGSSIGVPSPVAVAFRKSRRAQSNTDCETWVDDGKANTLNAFDTGDTRTTHAVCSIQGNLIGRVDGRPQGVGEGGRHTTVLVAPTLTAANNPSRSPQSAEITQQVSAVFFATGGMIVRRLTPVECERLQGFPDGWTDVGTAEKPTSDTHRYKQLGNAVTVNVAQWIARRSAECLR